VLAGGGALETATTFPGALCRGGQGTTALPVAKVALLSVALEGSTATLAATLTTGIRASGVVATAVAATVRRAAGAGKFGKRALAGPVGDLTSLNAVLGWKKKSADSMGEGGETEEHARGSATLTRTLRPWNEEPERSRAFFRPSTEPNST
jgi:hypothetical protein